MPKVYLLRGTWQSGGSLMDRIGMAVQHKIDPVHFRTPSSYGESMSYNDSVAYSVAKLTKHIEQHNDDYFLVGFSQGAHVAGTVAAVNKNNPRFKGAYLIADPARSPKDHVVNAPMPGGGIMGERKVGAKAIHIVAPGDFIAANTNKFISNVARYTYSMKLSDPFSWHKNLQAAAALREPGGNIKEALKEVRQSLFTGAHIRYGDYMIDGLATPEWIARDMLNQID